MSQSHFKLKHEHIRLPGQDELHDVIIERGLN
jgi:hypothetical protein